MRRRATRATRRSEGDVVLVLEDGRELTADELLVATGRRPATDDVGLDTVGLEPGKPVEVDDQLHAKGIDVIGYDHNPAVSDCASLTELVARMAAPRVVWVMVPAGDPTRSTVSELVGLLSEGDLVIEGGNSRFTDDQAHAELLATNGSGYLDVGVSGGVWGKDNGFALMVGGATCEFVLLGKTVQWVTFIPGVVLAVASFWIRRQAIKSLGKFWSLHVEIRQNHPFVRSGPFRWVRHPTYFSMILELVAAGLILQAWISLPICLALLLPVLAWRLRTEEAALVEQFGEAYRDYRRTTPALLPLKLRSMK